MHGRRMGAGIGRLDAFVLGAGYEVVALGRSSGDRAGATARERTSSAGACALCIRGADRVRPAHAPLLRLAHTFVSRVSCKTCSARRPGLAGKAYFIAVAVKAVTAFRDRTVHLVAKVRNTDSVRTVNEVLGALTIRIALDATVVRFAANRG